MKRNKVVLALLVTAIAMILLVIPTIHRHVVAASILAGTQSSERLVVEERALSLHGVRARRYAPKDEDDARLVMLVHGAHPGGIDEPRLVRFARVLAHNGAIVVTPHIESLTAMRFDPRAIDTIASAADAIASSEAREGVDVVAISFGGGLSLLAAARPRTRIRSVLAIGAHHDARRLVRWWTGDPITGPRGERTRVAPQRYGAQVLAYAYADEYLRGVPDVEAGRAVLRALVEERFDRTMLEGLNAETRARIDGLRHDLAPVRGRLRAIARAHERELAAVSPHGKLRSVRAPVFLLHGADDPLIASTEALWIDRGLAPQARGGVVRTGLLRHADTNALASWREQWEVVHLVAKALE